MKIGELAQRTGMATSAIRFYEASGLLPPTERGSNGYRQYGEAALQRLQMIQLGQRLGFGLDQLRELFAASRDGLPHELVLQGLDERLARIDQLAADLARQRAETLELRERLASEWAAGRCFTLDASGEEKAA
ncbi:MerR family transcriptional regulator [Roseateles saccharophilus]|nr:MerR family transcriptional regulator [Roseateles saccharophilus]MDG0832778.1 MerR family transcriptional regulator [Roseateles saccharophilus]